MKTKTKSGTQAVVKKPTGSKKKGRPTIFSEKITDEICARVAAGESLLKVCKDEHMPDRVTVYRWLLATDENGNKVHEVFCNKYEEAVNTRTDHMFDEIAEIADESLSIIKSGAEKKSSAYAAAQRLRVDARKWYLSKVMPKKYGDRQTVTTEDKDGNTVPIQGNVITFAAQE